MTVKDRMQVQVLRATTIGGSRDEDDRDGAPFESRIFSILDFLGP
jgi:hypothetical protein